MELLILVNEEDYSTIRIKSSLRNVLDSYKVEAESYSVVMTNLINENKRLKEDVEYLKEEKKDLYKLALKTSDSAALINNIHKATYFIAKVIEDVGTTEEEKLQVLKTYLKEMLEEDPTSILTAIEILKDMAEESSLDILTKFENYVKTSS